MAQSKDPENMKKFGEVMCKMMDWMIQNKPDAAAEWINELESIKWDNYLTPKEAEAIVSAMNPQRPWSRDQWKMLMEQHGYALEEEPYYNRCALYVTMCMIHSDSAETLKRFSSGNDLLEVIHALAIDKLKDRDGNFSVRRYFGL
jgi:hypothetical protein